MAMAAFSRSLNQSTSSRSHLLGCLLLGLVAAAGSSCFRSLLFATPFHCTAPAGAAAASGATSPVVPLVADGWGSTQKALSSRVGSNGRISVAVSAVPGGLYPDVLPTSSASGLEFMWEGAAGLVALYVIMSVNEYVYHRYFQHLGINKVSLARSIRDIGNLPTYKGDGHVEHHRETMDDMSLDRRAVPELDADPFRGTAFPWWAFCAMVVAVLGPSLPILGALGWSTNLIVPTVFMATLAHALVWNALHPDMHGLPDVPLSEGPPSFVFKGLRGSPVFEWLRVNHEGHHRVSGAHGNYNVCLPLVDQLAGTYVGEIPMKEVVQEGA